MILVPWGIERGLGVRRVGCVAGGPEGGQPYTSQLLMIYSDQPAYFMRCLPTPNK